MFKRFETRSVASRWTSSTWTLKNKRKRGSTAGDRWSRRGWDHFCIWWDRVNERFIVFTTYRTGCFWLISVGVSIAFGLAGMLAMRSWVRRLHGGHSHNDIVSVFFASMSVFYGVAVGLFAVGAWQTYSDVDSKLALESATIAQLYRDVSHYPEPARATLQGDLRVYVRKLIDVSWPQFRRGIVDTANNNTLNTFYAVWLSSSPQRRRRN